MPEHQTHADTPDGIDKAIELGINYLHQHQLPNGEFCTYMSGDDAMLGWNHPDSNVFTTVMISSSLLFLKHLSKVEEILQRSGVFLRYQMHWTGTCHYFTRLHPLRKIAPWDVDDTSCISHFLKERNIKFPKAVNTQLILDNRAGNGLFYSWFTLRFRWNSNKYYWRLVLPELLNPVKNLIFWKKNECGRYDIDAGVNANVLYYFGDIEATQPIIKYLLQVIADNKENDCDKWYRNPFTIYYFISRNYYTGITKLEPARQPIIDRILLQAKPDGCIGETVADTALAICSLINLNYHGYELQEAISFLISKQMPEGYWQRWRVYYGGPKLAGGYGSEELTTAFCLEALYRYAKMQGRITSYFI